MENNDKILVVSAEDEMLVKPDTVIISTIITGICDTYSNSADKGTENVANARKLFLECGLKDDSVKITRLTVNEERTRVEDEVKKDFKRTVEVSYKLLGYRYSAHVDIKLPIDDELVTKAYGIVINSDLFSGSSINYTLENDEEHYDKLLSRIVKKARHKADIIAEASGMKVKSVKDIDYSVSRLNVNFNRYKGASFGSALNYECASYNSSAEAVIGSECADDIKISDNITARFIME